MAKILGKFIRILCQQRIPTHHGDPSFVILPACSRRVPPPTHHHNTRLLPSWRGSSSPLPPPLIPPQEKNQEKKASFPPQQRGVAEIPAAEADRAQTRGAPAEARGNPEVTGPRERERERERERHEPHPDGGPAEGNSGCPPAGAVRSVGPRPPHQCVRLYPEGE